MIVVTGATGFIGSNLAHALMNGGYGDLMVVDEIEPGASFRHLEGLEPSRGVDKDVFLRMVQQRDSALDGVEFVFHQGACTDTLERDEIYLRRNNFEYSQSIIRYCQERDIPLVYASSAAVYGAGTDCREDPICEAPINEYAQSKKLLDDWVRADILPSPSAPVVGLRYFNVYGPREDHKGNMASMPYKMRRQLRDSGRIRLFGGSHGFSDGEQRRDFICVDDVIAVNLWFMEHPEHSGIFNCGTGRSVTFNAVARAMIDHLGAGEIEYVPFPRDLLDRYQARTRADLGNLRACGYDGSFTGVAEGIPAYLDWLDEHEIR